MAVVCSGILRNFAHESYKHISHNVEANSKAKHIADLRSKKISSSQNASLMDALHHHVFDLSGNRTRAEIRQTGEALRTIDYSYSAAAELLKKVDSKYGTTHFNYCINGNLISRRTTDKYGNTTNRTYTFDTLGRLEAVAEGGNLLLASLYDADNNRIFAAVGGDKPYTPNQATPNLPDTDTDASTDTARMWTLPHQEAPLEESTRLASLNEADEPDYTHTPQSTPPSQLDLFWYGVAQGISNLSHLSPYLTTWINSLWTLEAEKIRVDTLAANKRATHTETLYESLPSIASLDPQTDFADIMHYGHYTVKRFILDTNTTYPRVLATYNEKGEWTSTYTFGNGVTGMNTPQGAETFFTDGRGSVSEAINRQTRAITTYTYDAFGNVEVSGNSANHLTYNQEWFDFSTGLQFLRARYVDLELGRFVSRDAVLGTLEDPRTHNLYLYLQNDPLNNIDPSGHRLVNGGGGGPIGGQKPNCTHCRNGANLTWILPVCVFCRRTRTASQQTSTSQANRCIECGRQGCNRACMTPARNAPLPPPSGGGNQAQRGTQANNRAYFEICADIRSREEFRRVEYVSHFTSTPVHNSSFDSRTSFIASTVLTVASLFIPGVGSAALGRWLAANGVPRIATAVIQWTAWLNQNIISGSLQHLADLDIPDIIAVRTNTTYTLFISINYVTRRDGNDISRPSMISLSMNHTQDPRLRGHKFRFGFQRNMSNHIASVDRAMTARVNDTSGARAREQVNKYHREVRDGWNNKSAPAK